MRFIHPFEFDASTRWRSPETKSGDEDQIEYHADQRRYYKRLRAAAGCFEKARARDEMYVQGYVNLAATRDLLGQYDDALFWLRKASGRVDEEYGSPSYVGRLLAGYRPRLPGATGYLPRGG